MQLNIRSLNSLAAKNKSTLSNGQAIGAQDPNYYITMSISRDGILGGDDVSFTCTSHQKKVFGRYW